MRLFIAITCLLQLTSQNNVHTFKGLENHEHPQTAKYTEYKNPFENMMSWIFGLDDSYEKLHDQLDQEMFKLLKDEYMIPDEEKRAPSVWEPPDFEYR